MRKLVWTFGLALIAAPGLASAQGMTAPDGSMGQGPGPMQFAQNPPPGGPGQGQGPGPSQGPGPGGMQAGPRGFGPGMGPMGGGMGMMGMRGMMDTDEGWRGEHGHGEWGHRWGGRGAFFMFRRGDSVIMIRCAASEPMQACVNAAATLLDKVESMRKPPGQ